MAKKLTLEQRAAEYARSLKAMTLAWRDGAEEGYIAGWRARGRADALTKAERAELEEARSIIKAMVDFQTKRCSTDTRKMYPGAVPIWKRCVKFVGNLKTRSAK